MHQTYSDVTPKHRVNVKAADRAARRTATLTPQPLAGLLPGSLPSLRLMFMSLSQMISACDVSRGAKTRATCRSGGGNSDALSERPDICSVPLRSSQIHRTFCIRDSLSRRLFVEGSRRKRLSTT